MWPLAGSIVTIADEGPMSPIVLAIAVRASLLLLEVDRRVDLQAAEARPSGPYSLISSSLT